MTLYEQITAAQKFQGTPISLEEAVTTAESQKTALALNMAKRQAEAKPEPQEEKRLNSLPIPN